MFKAARSAWRELSRRSLPLAYVGMANAVLLVALVTLAAVDDRQITGLNRWIKPAKFAASVAVYTWTLAWYLGYLKPHRASVRAVGWGVAFCMVVEIACVVLQAARGQASHFNVATPFDGAVFSLMGLLIVVNTILAVYTLLLFCLTRVELPAAYLWGIRLGLLLFLAAGLEGFVMTGRSAHTVGLPDGGPGIPVLNWSTAGGDLRVAHFVGLHALQLIPLAGFLVSRHAGHTRVLSPAGWTGALALAYALLAGGLFARAIQGKPLVTAATSIRTEVDRADTARVGAVP